MAGTGRLSRKKELAIAALLTSDTVEQAAAKAGCSERSLLWRWLKQDEFQRVYKGARREIMHQAIGRLQDACATAVSTLQGVMNDVKAPASSRVSAARTCLEFAQRAVETEDLVARVEEMEILLTQVEG